MNKNKCYTYFAINGDFDPEYISKLLNLTPFQSWKKGVKRPHIKRVPTFSNWSYGLCDTYDVVTENQMMKTIADLVPKIPVLQRIQKELDTTFTLQVVPTAFADEATPALGAGKEIIAFCCKTNTTIDIDLYVDI